MKIAIIGLGDIAQKAYLPVITQLEGVELVFCTRNSDTLARLSNKYRVKECCTDYKLLPQFNIDAVMIHAATSAHPEIARYFLHQGIATFVDKPLANSAALCEELYELAEIKSQPLYVGFNRRHIPLYNQHMIGVQRGDCAELSSLRWEKNRFNQVGEIKDFIFDDFIHPLDSVNIYGKSDISDAYITHQMQGDKLARVDIQWQQNNQLLHASMNRQHGITNEIVSANIAGESYQFDSFSQGYRWRENEQVRLSLKDWTPMLASKGFDAMIADWLAVVSSGKLDSDVVCRNIASHQLADSLYQKLVSHCSK